MKRYLKLVIALVSLVLLLTACARPQATPETPRQTYAMTNALYVGVVNTAIELRQRSLIDDKAFLELEQEFKAMDELLGSVQDFLMLGQEDEALTRLRALNFLLWELDRHLKELEARNDE